MVKVKKKCEHCGAPMVEYKHALSKGLVKSLIKLYHAGWPLNVLRNLGLSTIQLNNFQKLKYFGLIEKVTDGKNKYIAGMWTITPSGLDFINGKVFVQRYVYTYRNKVISYDGDLVKITDCLPENWRTIEDYRADMRVHT